MLRLFNSLLQQEPWAQERMRQYLGKTVKFQLPLSSLVLSINAHGLVMLSEKEAVPNVIVTVKAEDMSALLQELSRAKPGSTPDIKRLMSYVYIEGEAGLANLVSDLARDLRWDRASYLANLIGPVLTSHLLRTERLLLERGQAGVKTLLRVGADSLSYDQEILVASVQFNDLNREIEALEQRLGALESTLAKGQ
ncbi:ubiquinone biosynthesis accessory factor UbiJ [Oligella urethralis]|uniref:ubiquinone biosynthesis accessory factor UbiJ n=1 Tax=Oligella urethralis TaxID=90245 RepID=UPI001FCFF258|nr:SCP2 sterol-binding domain-containing protein [Oligella urethralis]